MKIRVLGAIAIAGLIASGMTGCSSKSDSQDNEIPAEAKQAAQVQEEEDGQEAITVVELSELLGALVADGGFGGVSAGKIQNKVLASLPSFEPASSQAPQVEDEGEQDCEYGGTRTYENSTPSFSGHYINTYTYNNCVESYLPCGLSTILPDPYDLHLITNGSVERYTMNGVYIDEGETDSNGHPTYTHEAQSLTVNVKDTTEEKIYDASADGTFSTSQRDITPNPAPTFTERIYTANIEQSLKTYDGNGDVAHEMTSSAVNVELNATSSEYGRIFVANGYRGVTTDGELSYLIFENYVSTWSWPAVMPLDDTFTADITINGTVGASCLEGQVNVTTTETIVLDTSVGNHCNNGETPSEDIPGYQLSNTIPRAGEVEISGDGEAGVSFDYNGTTNIASATITTNAGSTTYTCAEDMIADSGCGDSLNLIGK